MIESIRVLQVFGIMNRGGAETMIMNLYRGIDRGRIQFDFVVHTDQQGAFDMEIESLGGKIYHAPSYAGVNHFKYKKWWALFFNLHPEYKVVHSHVRSTANIILSLAKKNGRVTISHSHSTSNGTGLSSLVKNIFQKSINKYSDQRLACSNEAGKWLFGKNTFRVINNAIDTSLYAFDDHKRELIRKELILSNNFVIGHVGRFTDTKNHIFLVEIYDIIQCRYPNARLLLVGDGPLKAGIQQMVHELGLSEKVLLTGVRVDVPDLMRAMDVFIFPSKYEGLPVTLIEAQASGLPCIVSDTVSEEVKIVEDIEFVSLSKPAAYWADRAMDHLLHYQREDKIQFVKKAGYDTVETARFMEKFYIEAFLSASKASRE